jgi:hypothetical protein
MTEPTPPTEGDDWFVTPSDLGRWMGGVAVDDKLHEALGAALEWTAEQIGPLDNVARPYSVWPSGRHLVLPDDHIEEVVSITDPYGVVTDVPPQRINLLAGVIELNTAGALRSGPWTVVAKTRKHHHSVALAVKIIASHLYEVHRGRAVNSATQAVMGGVTPVGDPDGAPKGFAIPRRAAELLAPFLRV